jgi:hypothetical protein
MKPRLNIGLLTLHRTLSGMVGKAKQRNGGETINCILDVDAA